MPTTMDTCVFMCLKYSDVFRSYLLPPASLCEQSLGFYNNSVVSTSFSQPLNLMLGWGLDGGWFREYVLDMT